MIFVTQKKFKLEKSKKQLETLKFCSTEKSNAQEAHKQGLLKCIKSDFNGGQRKIFSRKSVTISKFIGERFFQENPLKIFPETSKDFFKKIRYHFKIYWRKIFSRKSVTISKFIGERFFQENPLKIFPETSKDFILKKGLHVLKTSKFINPETPIDRHSLRAYFQNYLKSGFSWEFLYNSTSKIIFVSIEEV